MQNVYQFFINKLKLKIFSSLKQNCSLNCINTKLLKGDLTDILGTLLDRNQCCWLRPSHRYITATEAVANCFRLTDGIGAVEAMYPPLILLCITNDYK